jgi:hypothetical protein
MVEDYQPHSSKNHEVSYQKPESSNAMDHGRKAHMI